MHSPAVVIIDELLARKYFPNEDPVGKHLTISAFNTQCEIVGVVGHAKQFGLTEGGKEGEPQLYYASM